MPTLSEFEEVLRRNLTDLNIVNDAGAYAYEMCKKIKEVEKENI